MIAAFLHSQAPKIAAQVVAMMPPAAKAALSDDELEQLNKIVADVDLTGWSVLSGDVAPMLDEIVRDGSVAALHQVGVDTEARRDVMNVVNKQALDYAAERSAEMVGMRRNAAGDLVENPDARWRIDESTRDMLRTTVGEAMAEGWSNDRLAKEIGQSYGFSEERAMVIARTETQFAANHGALNAYKASGVVDAKQWLTAEDDLVSEECAANGAAGENGDGVIGLDDVFPSGDDAPPVHPNCRCTIAPVVNFEAQEAQAKEDEKTVDQDVQAQLDRETTSTPVDTKVEVGPAVTPAAAAAAEPEAPTPTVNWHGSASDAFRALVNATLDSFPTSVMTKLAEKDVTFEFGERLTQIMPELKGVHPRGWPKGMTWDSAEGLFDGRAKQVVVSETYRPPGQKKFVDSQRVEGAIRHETGHGFDFAMGWISEQPEFSAAYAEDRKAITASATANPSLQLMSRLSYYLQGGVAGRHEAFAEVFGWIQGGGAHTWQDIRVYFPAVTKFIEELIAKLESEEANA